MPRPFSVQPNSRQVHFLVRTVKHPVFWAAFGSTAYGVYCLILSSKTQDELRNNASKKDQSQVAAIAVSTDPKITAQLGLFGGRHDSSITVRDSIKGVEGSEVNIGHQHALPPKSRLK